MDRNMILLLLLALIFMAAQDCNASFLNQIRKLSNKKPSHQIPPASAPSQGAPSPRPTNDGLSTASCTSSLEKCNNESHHINITACLMSSSNSKMQLYLLVQNHGESSIEVNVKTNTTLRHIQILKHGIEKVNVTDGRSSYIELNAGNDKQCVIHFKSPVPPNNFFWHFSYNVSYANPLNGVYLLLISAVIFGWTWACCVKGKRAQHVDGVPYRELEMSGNGGDVEDGWDQGWDDDWGETKPVRSPRERQNGNVSINGLASSTSLD